MCSLVKKNVIVFLFSESMYLVLGMQCIAGFKGCCCQRRFPKEGGGIILTFPIFYATNLFTVKASSPIYAITLREHDFHKR